jgi:RNA polymerase sigma factor (sigma-70 family)
MSISITTNDNKNIFINAITDFHNGGVLLLPKVAIVNEQEISDAMNYAKAKVHSYMKSWHSKFSKQELESAAFEGIAEAIQRFEPKNGSVQDTKFTSYAHFWIEKYIKTYIANNKTILSGSLHDLWVGSVPYAYSIDDNNDDGPSSDCTAMVKDKSEKNSADFVLIKSETDAGTQELLNRILSRLSGLDKIVVQLHFGIDTIDDKSMTIKEIAKNLGISSAKAQGHLDSAMTNLSDCKQELMQLYLEMQ